MIKILVVDDSALVRKLLGQVFAGQSDFEVKFARNGVEGLAQNKAFEPDVITLDIHMPEMDGLECLDRIMLERPCPVVMVSSLTEEAAAATLEALRLGAIDVVTKPSGAVSLHIDAFGAQLVAKVRNAAKAKIRASLRLKERVRKNAAGAKSSAQKARAGSVRTIEKAEGEGVVLVGASTGGPPALEALLTALPADFAWPLIIAQHMPGSFTGALAKRLDRLCGLEVVEVTHAVRIKPGQAYIGHGDSDLVVARRGGRLVATSVPSQADYLWHPSVDRLVRSALEHMEPSQLIGVLMTGMGNDGASAMALLRERGGRTIAESEETAVVWGMPGELVKAQGADWVLPLPEIAERLQRLTP
ncbi:MAG: chemotaxis-specific protein-glutamate methyltransferase CheB [Caulobacterales bacterium]